jgi:2',3'-cyclic-nucleotide 2'-phosphodiesterase (5'-nucleotidase family)
MNRHLTQRGAIASIVLIVLVAGAVWTLFSGHFFAPKAQEPSPPAAGRTLTLVFCADAKGQLEPCNCPGGKNGGWLRAATCIDQMKAKGSPIVFLYGGNLIRPGSPGTQGFPKAEGLLRILTFFDCKAMSLGADDLSYGHEFLLQKAKAENVPVLCANIQYSYNSETVFPPYTVTTVSKESFPEPISRDIKLGILGLIGQDSQPVAGKLAQDARLAVVDPVQAADKYIPELRKECDLLIVLGDLERGTIDAIIAKHPEIDAFVSPRLRQQPPSGPPPERKTVVFYGGIDLWKNLGIMNLALDADGKLTGGDIDTELLSSDKYPDQTQLRVEIAKIKANVADYIRERSETMRGNKPKTEPAEKTQPKQVEIRPSAPASFVGAKTCNNCHAEIFKQWSQTAHARAFESLGKECENDDDCLPCHTTGYGMSSGFITIEKTPDLKGVQCEWCHGLGSAHAETPDVRLTAAAKNVCISCHNERRSPDFDEKTYMEKIRHWKDNGD